MLAANARGPIGRFLAPIGRALARTPISPNAITVVGGTGAVVAAVTLLATGELFWGTVVVAVFVLLDMLDGALARAQGSGSPFGAFLDSTFDRVSDGAIFASLAWWYLRDGAEPWLAALALFSLVAGVVISYIKARAEGLGYECNVGFAERAERLLLALFGSGLQGLGLRWAMATGLWVLAVVSVVTIGQRLVAVHRQFVASASVA